MKGIQEGEELTNLVDKLRVLGVVDVGGEGDVVDRSVEERCQW